MMNVLVSPNYLRCFSRAIFEIVRECALSPSENRQQRHFKEAIDGLIRKYSNFIPHRVSKQAHHVAQQIDLAIDLRTKTWHDQTKFDPGRQKFIVEHKTPVSKIRSLCLEATDADSVAQILDTHLCVVWITREENNQLNNNGHRSHRTDPNAAYLRANIVVIG